MRRGPGRRAGFKGANPELMIKVAIVAIIAAVAIPIFVRIQNQGRAHACAVHLDAVAETQGADPGTCGVEPCTTDSAGNLCCRYSHAEAEDRLCRVRGGEALAATHPAPGRFSLGIAGLFAFGPIVVMFLAIGASLIGDLRR